MDDRTRLILAAAVLLASQFLMMDDTFYVVNILSTMNGQMGLAAVSQRARPISFFPPRGRLAGFCPCAL